MPKDKYTAIWLSHSSIRDFLECPRGYFLKNIYKDPQKNKKIKIVTPALALGQAVHATLEALSQLPTPNRFDTPLPVRLKAEWEKVSGRRGGFLDAEHEFEYLRRAEEMIRRVYQHPGPIARLAIKLPQELPYMWLSEEDNIILCGKIDWIEYLKETESIHLIDFKTGAMTEDTDSLQLPIYTLLVSSVQSRPVSKVSYWYLGFHDDLVSMPIPALDEARRTILEIGKKIKLARQLERFGCLSAGCRACTPFERILRGEGEYVGVDEYGASVYLVPPPHAKEVTLGEDGTIL